MLKGIAEDKPPEPMLLSIYGRDPRVANDWAQVTLKPAQDAIADFKSSDATNGQFLRIDVAPSELLESLRANYPPYKGTISPPSIVPDTAEAAMDESEHSSAGARARPHRERPCAGTHLLCS